MLAGPPNPVLPSPALLRKDCAEYSAAFRMSFRPSTSASCTNARTFARKLRCSEGVATGMDEMLPVRCLLMERASSALSSKSHGVPGTLSYCELPLPVKFSGLVMERVRSGRLRAESSLSMESTSAPSMSLLDVAASICAACSSACFRFPQAAGDGCGKPRDELLPGSISEGGGGMWMGGAGWCTGAGVMCSSLSTIESRQSEFSSMMNSPLLLPSPTSCAGSQL